MPSMLMGINLVLEWQIKCSYELWIGVNHDQVYTWIMMFL